MGGGAENCSKWLPDVRDAGPELKQHRSNVRLVFAVRHLGHVVSDGVHRQLFLHFLSVR